MTIEDRLANKTDIAKHWQGVSPRMRCVVVPFVRCSQAFAKFARAFVSIHRKFGKLIVSNRR